MPESPQDDLMHELRGVWEDIRLAIDEIARGQFFEDLSDALMAAGLGDRSRG